MKTFTAACLMSSAMALDVVAVPAYVAGFVYRFTGQNKLTELTACLKDDTKVFFASEHAFEDFHGGFYKKGIQEAGAVWANIGSAMTDCKGMENDIAAMEAWAKIFTEPAKLAI